MCGSHSREDLEISDSEEGRDYEDHDEEEANYHDAEEERRNSSERKSKTPSSLDDVEAKLKTSMLNYSSSQNSNLKNAIKLYHHIGGNTEKAKWLTSEKLTSSSRHVELMEMKVRKERNCGGF